MLLLSATPMQTHPWEPWDLLQVLGEGDRWLSDFGTVRRFYEAVARLKSGQCDMDLARSAALTVLAVLAVVLVLQYAQAMVIPIVLGVLVSYALEPAVTGLVRLHLPRRVALKSSTEHVSS